jgi:hypothetical protein
MMGGEVPQPPLLAHPSEMVRVGVKERKMENPIGWLYTDGMAPGYFVVCNDCRTDEHDPVYRANILPYHQTCIKCRKVVVQGRGSIRTELFDGK